jgi:hypothetical protein
MLPYPTPPSGGGLYVIRLSDNHYYGGRTKAFTNRWAVHYRLLRDGKHFNAHAQAVFNQHGRFEPEVLCVTSNEGGRRELEGLWLQGNVGKPGCVNLSRSADGVHVGYTHSEATRVKHRRPVHTDESKEKCRQAARRPRKSYTPHPHTEESRAKLCFLEAGVGTGEGGRGQTCRVWWHPLRRGSRQNLCGQEGASPPPHRGKQDAGTERPPIPSHA